MDCGHTCCGISANPCHSHQQEPENCARCTALLGTRPVDIGAIVADVIRCVVPEIPGLPDGPELIERVGVEVTAACRRASREPALFGLDAVDFHITVAGRVALALAFPRPAPTATEAR